MPGPFARMREAQQNWRANNGNLQERLAGLLGGENDIGNIGLGLLSNSGPRPVGTANFGTRLSEATQFAQGRQRMAMENQAYRNSLLQQKRQADAQQQITGLLGDPNADPNQIIGLLSQASPDQVNQQLIQGLLGQQQERTEPAQVRIARILSDPNESSEVKEAIRAQMASDGTEDLNLQVQLELNRMRLNEAAREAEREAETERVSFQTSQVSTNRLLGNLREAAALNERLSDTMLRSGATFNQVKRAASEGVAEIRELFGVDSSEAREINAAFDRFNKLTSELIIQDIGRISGSGVGAMTNQSLQILSDSMAGIGVAPEANAKIFGSAIKDILGMAGIEGYEIQDIDGYQSLSESLLDAGVMRRTPIVDSTAVSNRATEVGRNAIDVTSRAINESSEAIQRIGQMTLDQINSLNFEEMPQSQLDAVMQQIQRLQQ